MNKIRKRITFLILIFVSFALMAPGCIGSTAKTDQEEMEAELARQFAAVSTDVAATKTEVARPKTPTPTLTPTATATATHTPTPQSVTTTVNVGQVAEFKTFNVSVIKAQYQAPDPKGAYRFTVVLENKTSTDLTYSAKNFSVTSSAGQHKLNVLPKLQGSTWSDEFLPNSSVSAGAKATLEFLAELSGLEKDFVLWVIFGNDTANILLGR